MPACPICGAADERPPDALGVHRCSACAIEFRPRLRMPIRGATLGSASSSGEQRSGRVAVVVVVIVAVMLVAFSVGEREAKRRAAALDLLPPIPALDSATLDLLDSLATLEHAIPRATLAHEVHLSQISEGELFATGVVHADSIFEVQQVGVKVYCRDLAGALLSVPDAVVSCRSMQPGERCAWMIDAPVEGSIAQVEFRASATRAPNFAALDLRSERGEVELDANRRLLEFHTRDSVSGAWATVTAYSSEQRVLGVSETRWPDDPLMPDHHELPVALPKPPDEVARYEVRVGAEL